MPCCSWPFIIKKMQFNYILKNQINWQKDGVLKIGTETCWHAVIVVTICLSNDMLNLLLPFFKLTPLLTAAAAASAKTRAKIKPLTFWHLQLNLSNFAFFLQLKLTVMARELSNQVRATAPDIHTSTATSFSFFQPTFLLNTRKLLDFIYYGISSSSSSWML